MPTDTSQSPGRKVIDQQRFAKLSPEPDSPLYLFIQHDLEIQLPLVILLPLRGYLDNSDVVNGYLLSWRLSDHQSRNSPTKLLTSIMKANTVNRSARTTTTG